MTVPDVRVHHTPGELENPARARLRAFRPEWCLYWAGAFSVSQFEIWAPYLTRSRHRFLVVAEGAPIPAALIEQVSRTAPNIAFGHSGWRLDTLKNSRSLQGFLYPGNRMRNFSVVSRFPTQSHIWIGHGDSRKASSYPRVATLYDAIFVSRYAMLEDFAPDVAKRLRWRALAIGAPIPEGLLHGTPSRRIDVSGEPLVLYCPTWESYWAHNNYTSLDVVATELERLGPSRRFDLMLHPHPGTGQQKPHFSDTVTRLYSLGARPSTNKVADMNAADVLLGDISGSTSEFLFTGKPTILTYGPHLQAVGMSRDDLRQRYPYAHIWDPAESSLADAVSAALDDARARRRSNRARTRAFRRHETLDDAGSTFDLALAWASRHASRPRLGYELQRRSPRDVRRAAGMLRRGVRRARRALRRSR